MADGRLSPLPDTWVDGLTIGQALGQTVSRYSRQDAVVFPKLDLRWTWSEFQEQIGNAAKGLLRLGIGFGDHVAIWSTNRPPWLVLQLATAQIGAVLVTINPAYRPFELRYALQKSDAKALVLADRFKNSDYYQMFLEVCPKIEQSAAGEIQSEGFPNLKRVIGLSDETPSGVLPWSEMVGGGCEVEDSVYQDAQQKPAPSDAINIQYTSGTTGFPKAATLSHRNLLLNAYFVGACQKLTESDRICAPVPFYHCFGCVLGTLAACVYGAAMIVPGEFFNATDTLDAVEKERATVLYGVPTMFIAELEDPSFSSRDLTSLRTGIMAGSPCPIEVMRKVVDRMGARELTIAYGQTEASPVITQTRTDDPLELRVETVGRPIPGVEVKIVDPSSDEELPEGQQGELCARGHVVMLGYYNDAESTAAAIDQQGWLHTGDLAMRIAQGYYKITGRIKEMVIRGGENIYPREIEEYLFTHPAIEQAAVVGVPDDKFGEELVAWVIRKADQQLTEQQLKDFCRRGLAHYKTPRYVRFVQEFPQTVTGKVQKFKIREQMMADLGLKEQETA